jgi:hypothetical protein
VLAAEELPGVPEDDMSTQNGQRKHGTTRGLPRRRREEYRHTATATGISPLSGEIGLCLRVGRMGPNK